MLRTSQNRESHGIISIIIQKQITGNLNERKRKRKSTTIIHNGTTG